MASDFVHLHLHSEYSLLDGGNRMESLVDRIAELGMDAVALTDHGNLFGAVAFYRACQKRDIKPILGIEAYVAPDIHTEVSDRRLKETHGVADGGFHLVLLARNQAGWRNLVRLSTDSYIEGFYYRPRMDKGTIAQWNEGLIAINGHMGSSLAYHLQKDLEDSKAGHWERARAEALWHLETFPADEDGEPCFYLELQRHETDGQDELNEQILRLADELDLPAVCDNDAHFLTAEDWDSHDTLICVSTGKSKKDEDRLHYPKDLYVRSPEQMAELFGDPRTEDALRNTRRIADRCNVELDFSANHAPLVRVERGEKPPLPEAGSPADRAEWFQRFCASYRIEPLADQPGDEELAALHADCDDALRELAQAGLVWRYGSGIEEAHRHRLDHELSVVAGKRISAYFLIVWDFVNEARKRGIPATARGSGVGTMVGYLLGLSHACPVRYGLLFERFTDPDRAEYPDIDIDLCQDGRAEILDYVREKYGYVAQIITFGTMKARAAIRDVGRVLELPLAQVDRISKLIGPELGVTIDQAMEREKELRELHENDEQVRAVIDTARQLEGITRHSGVHAAGLVIATEPLQNLCPLATNRSQGSKDALITQWDGPTVEAMGLLKMDFLGLTTLSVIERCRQLVQETLPPEAMAAAVPGSEGRDPLDLDHIDLADRRVLDVFASADTAGTFQFESEGMRNLLLQMKPDRLEDLVAANALFRPGPMDLIPDYCDRKHGRQEVPRNHEIVDRHTAETHGIMVFQEQVMQIVHELGDVPLREAYTLIKAISKKNRATINAAKQRFLDGAREKGLSTREATTLFAQVEKFAGYGFNKSHSVGYSLLAYQTAYLKTWFPVQFMAAILTYAADSKDKLVHYIDECARVKLPDGGVGITVGAPDIDRSGVRFHVVFEPGEEKASATGHIRFGLSAVKGVGEKAVRAILEVREAGGPFRSLWDFCRRVPLQAVNRSTIEALIKSGAFDGLHGKDQRAAMLEALEPAIKAGQRAAADRESGQGNLFGGGALETAAADDDRPLPATPPWSTAELLDQEKETLGFFASSHPLDDHRRTLGEFGNVTVKRLKTLPADTEVVLGALVGSVADRRTRRGRNAGQKMAVVQVEDRSDRIEAVLFAEACAKYEAHLERGAVLFFSGRVDRRREEPSLVVNRVATVEEARTTLSRRLRIHLDLRPSAGSDLHDVLARLRDLLDQRRSRSRNGGVEVEFELELEDRLVRTDANGSRAPIKASLAEEIDNLLGDRGHCRYLGPPPPAAGP